MSNFVHVHLWGHPVGTAMDVEGVASFEYAPEFEKAGLDIAPVAMPLGTRGPRAWPRLPKDTFHGLPSFLADALPDQFGMKVWASHLRGQGRELEDIGPVHKLALMGSRAMGALEFVPDLSRSDRLNDPDCTPIEEVWRMAQALLAQKESLVGALQDDPSHLLRFCGSPGGARAKALVAVNELGEVKAGQAPAGPGFTHWILKFDGLDASGGHLGHQLGESRVEYAYALMAQAAGIEMMPCRLHEHHDAAAGLVRHHFMTQRFDRQGDDKIHMQTWCALAGMDYGNPNHAYEEVMEMTLATPALGFHHEHRLRLFRRMVFNVAAKVTDDHTKNMGFLMRRDGKWDLAPAYDLVPGGVSSVHRMSVNGKKAGIRQEDLLAVAKVAGIKTAAAKEVIHAVCGAVAAWDAHAHAAGVSAELIAKTRDKIASAGHVFVPVP